MNLFIRTLLPMIAVLIHILELNASSGHNEEGSSRPNRYPQQAETSQRRQSETPPQQLQHTQQNPRAPYQRHTQLFREPQLEQELHQPQTIPSETSQRQQIPRTPRKRQQQQLAQDPHRLNALQLQKQRMGQELNQLQQPIQSETPRNQQRERTPQQQDLHRIYALQLRRQQIEQELTQLLQPIQSETPQNRQRQRPPQQQEQPQLGQEPNQLNSLQLQQQIEQELPRLRQQYPLAEIRITDPPIIFDCFDKQLKASVAYFNDIRKVYACQVIGGPHFNPFIPDMNYRKNNKFAAVECSINDVRCVAYVDERGRVLGAKLPPNSNDRQRPGNPAKLHPTASTSFIIFNNQVFKVTQNPHTKQVQDIGLLPFNRVMSQNSGQKNDVARIINVRCCGMLFSGHKSVNGHIVGTSLIATEGPQYLYNPRYM